MRVYLLDWAGQPLRWLQPITGAAEHSGYTAIRSFTGITSVERAVEADWYAQIGH